MDVPESEFKEAGDGLKCVYNGQSVVPRTLAPWLSRHATAHLLRPRPAPRTEFGLDLNCVFECRIYDVKVGGGQTAKVGDRVAVHYEARWRGITFMTSSQGRLNTS